MAGILSNLFEGDNGSQTQVAGGQRGDDSPGPEDQIAADSKSDQEADFDIDPDVDLDNDLAATVTLETEASWTDFEGVTHNPTNTTTLAIGETQIADDLSLGL